MTKKELSQIYYLNREIEMWQIELESLRDISSVKLNGMPKGTDITDATGEKAIRAAQISNIIEGKLKELQIKRKEIYEFITELDDPLMRQIVMYRCLSLCTWEEVAIYVGGRNTAESVRKMFDRFFLK